LDTLSVIFPIVPENFFFSDSNKENTLLLVYKVKRISKNILELILLLEVFIFF